MARGKLIVISAPSGAGKTTIAQTVLASHPSMKFSVSATTRPRRENEADGRDYYFLSKDEFRRRVDAGKFVEWEEIYGNYYGTLKAELDRCLAEGTHLLFDIDVKGALSIKRHYPEALLIFIRPPSIEMLLDRLKGRKTEDAATIVRRMERAPMEMETGMKFDHQVVNDDLGRAIAEVEKIVQTYLTN